MFNATTLSSISKSRILSCITIVLLTDLLILCIPFHWAFKVFFAEKESKELAYIIQGSLRICLGIYFMNQLMLSARHRFNPFRVSSPLTLLIPFIYPMILTLPAILKIQASDLSPALWLPCLAFLSMAMAEEVLIRGLVLSLLLKKFGEHAILRSVIISSLVFAFLHLVNLYRMNWIDVLIQVIISFSFGVFFGALMMKTKNLLYLGLNHGLINIFFNLDEVLRKPVTAKFVTDWQGILKAVVTTALVFSPLLIMGYVMMKKMEKRRRPPELRTV